MQRAVPVGLCEFVWNGHEHRCRHCLETHSAPQQIARRCKSFGMPKSENGLQKPVKASSVAVVITCHNYGRFLGVCLESALSQSPRPAELLVVNDASTDETEDVCRSMGVRCLTVDVRSAGAARWRGLQEVESEFVLFLDADDLLPAGFLRTGLAGFTDAFVAGVYCDHQRFGLETKLQSFPDKFDRGKLFRENYIGASTVWRRSVLQLFPVAFQTDDMVSPCDYKLAMMAAQSGWEFRKQSTPLRYRRHGPAQTSLAGRQRRIDLGYAKTHGLDWQDLTLFIPLSGRIWAWERQSKFLEEQTFPHGRLRLILCDTSQDDGFSSVVRRWAAGCDYGDVRHFRMSVEAAGLADEERRNRKDIGRRVDTAMCRIYGRLAACVETDWLWILEDDVIPPADVLDRLMLPLNARVGAVCAPYLSRFVPFPVVTDLSGDKPKHVPPGEGVQKIDAAGFGCVLLRAELIRSYRFAPAQNGDWFDTAFWRSMPADLSLLCDWDCWCEHLEKPVLEVNCSAHAS